MSYRDPLEAMRAENESLKAELRSTREALDQAAAQQGAGDSEGERSRWALGVRCLGGLAMMAPFLLMTALCEHRMMPSGSAYRAALSAPSPHGRVPGQGCVMARPHVGFERFTQAVERPARVVESENLAATPVGQTCTVRVAPVAMLDFNCHVDVICNGEVLYGVHPMGYAHCDVDGANVLRASDPYVTTQDQDPAVSVDFTSSRVVVEDRRDGRATRAVLLITPSTLPR